MPALIMLYAILGMPFDPAWLDVPEPQCYQRPAGDGCNTGALAIAALLLLHGLAQLWLGKEERPTRECPRCGERVAPADDDVHACDPKKVARFRGENGL